MQTPVPEQLEALSETAIELLKALIRTPSFSKEEDNTAKILLDFFQAHDIPVKRHKHNIWAQNLHFESQKPTILLNSHHDTVRPNAGYTRDPFDPAIADGKLYGLGSNDAGGCLVSLLATFSWFYAQENLPFNLVFAASAEEEISGKDGIEALLPLLPRIDFGVVGEPTKLQLAVAEKGLMVLDCKVLGKAGHAAREEGQNAIYEALPDIEWFRTFLFPKQSPWLGAVKMSVTSIETPNKAHNVVPDICRFIVDVRQTEVYTLEEILATIKQHVRCEAIPRSMRMRATGIPLEHPLVQSGLQLGKEPYGSPTGSDKAFMDFPTLKMGPGDSARSHSADEFIYVQEIKEGIETYIALLQNLKC